MNTLKTYFAKVYSPTVSGSTTSGILSTIQNVDFPGFTWGINAGLGPVQLKFPRPFNNFGEGTDIAMFNQYDIYVNDRESGQDGYKIYSGEVMDYTPILDGPNEYVIVTLWGYASEFAVKVLESDVGATTLAYSAVQASDIVKDAMNRYDGKVTYTSSSIQDTGNTISYAFRQNTLQEYLDTALRISPVYWYWRVGPDNILNYKVRDTTTIDHMLTLGKDVTRIAPKRSGVEIRNAHYFLGGSTLYTKDSRTTSGTTFGKRGERFQDQRITDQTTAKALSDAYLNFFDHIVLTTEVVVVDSNGDGGTGYNIELFKPGDIVQINDPRQDPQVTLWDVATWDISQWDYPITSAIGVPLQIMSVSYELNQATLSLALEAPDISKMIESIQTNLFNTITANTPTTPTLV